MSDRSPTPPELRDLNHEFDRWYSRVDAYYLENQLKAARASIRFWNHKRRVVQAALSRASERRSIVIEALVDLRRGASAPSNLDDPVDLATDEEDEEDDPEQDEEVGPPAKVGTQKARNPDLAVSRPAPSRRVARKAPVRGRQSSAVVDVPEKEEQVTHAVWSRTRAGRGGGKMAVKSKGKSSAMSKRLADAEMATESPEI